MDEYAPDPLNGWDRSRRSYPPFPEYMVLRGDASLGAGIVVPALPQRMVFHDEAYRRIFEDEPRKEQNLYWDTVLVERAEAIVYEGLSDSEGKEVEEEEEAEEVFDDELLDAHGCHSNDSVPNTNIDMTGNQDGGDYMEWIEHGREEQLY